MTYAIRTPFLFWFGATVLVLTSILIIASWNNWLSMFLLATMFGGSGAALLFMSASISGDIEGLSVTRLRSTKKVQWNDVERVAEGGGNIVVYTQTGRITAPSIEFWTGAEKHQLIALIASQLQERRIPVSSSNLTASIQVGDR